MSRNAILLSIVGALAVGALAWLFLIQPQLDELDELDGQVQAAQTEADSLRSRISALEEIRARAPEIEAQIVEIEAIVPTDPGLPTAFRQIQAAADDAGVRLTAMTPSRPTTIEDPASPMLYEIGLSMTLEGSYFQAVDFLRRLEDPAITSRGLLVDSTTMSIDEEYPTLSIAVDARMFAVLEEPPLPPEEVPPPPADEESPADGESPEDGESPADDQEDGDGDEGEGS